MRSDALECPPLNAFLTNPTETEAWIQIPENRVEYAKSQLRKVSDQPEHQTHIAYIDLVRGLKIKKTQMAWSVSTEKREWDEDQTAARRFLQEMIPKERLRGMLGDDIDDFLGGFTEHSSVHKIKSNIAGDGFAGSILDNERLVHFQSGSLNEEGSHQIRKAIAYHD